MKLDALRGIGPRTREALGRLGIDSVESLLLHLPMRYEDRTRVRPLGDIAPGDSARFCVRIDDSRVGFGGRRSLLLRASDASGSVGLRLFHFRREQQERLRVGSWWLCWGEVRESRWGLECVHPQMQAVAGPETLPDPPKDGSFPFSKQFPAFWQTVESGGDFRRSLTLKMY